MVIMDDTYYILTWKRNEKELRSTLNKNNVEISDIQFRGIAQTIGPDIRVTVRMNLEQFANVYNSLMNNKNVYYMTHY